LGKLQALFHHFQRCRSTGFVFVATLCIRHTHCADQTACSTYWLAAFHHNQAVDMVKLGANVGAGIAKFT
jgi:hypothetical protein